MAIQYTEEDIMIVLQGLDAVQKSVIRQINSRKSEILKQAYTEELIKIEKVSQKFREALAESTKK